jgi:glycerate 2-kinase
MTAFPFSREHDVVQQLFSAALAAVDPTSAVRRVLALRGDDLIVGSTTIPAPGGVHIVAVGKAAVAMTQGAIESLGGAVRSGDVITKEGHAERALPDSLRVFEAGHPIPDRRGVNATRSALDALEKVPPDAVVLALISGGGSALLEAPKEGLTLADFSATTDLLLRAGASINALNAVRAPMSRVKAGGLRTAAPHARWVTLILSDVLGNDPRVIASGPTVPGGNDPETALATIDRFALREELPPAVIKVLEAMPTPATEPRPDDILLIIGDNASAVSAALDKARELGLEVQVVWVAAEGEAADLGRDFVDILLETPSSVDIVLGGGEATVTVRGDGCGGRNTEFALAAAIELERRQTADWVVASLGTDGQDAMTGYAGAIADPESTQRARAAGVDPLDCLLRNDSLRVFEVAGGAIKSGPTGTNVNDLYIAVRVRKPLNTGTAKGV